MVMGRMKKGSNDPVEGILSLLLGIGLATVAENEVGTEIEMVAGRQMEVRANGDVVLRRDQKLSLWM